MNYPGASPGVSTSKFKTMDHLQKRINDAIGLLTLNRPETINALNKTMIAELEKAFQHRLVVLVT